MYLANSIFLAVTNIYCQYPANDAEAGDLVELLKEIRTVCILYCSRWLAALD